MFAKIDFCAQNSKLKSVSAQLKVLVSVVTLIITISISSLEIMTAVIFIAAVITALIGKTNLGFYLKMLRVPMAFIALSAVAIAFEYSRDLQGIFAIGNFAITQNSLHKTVILSVKAVAGVSILYTLCLSTPIYEIFAVLKKIKVPSIIIELMYLIYRYIFILSMSLEEMKISAKLRMGFNGYKATINTTGSIMINLFILSLKKASQSFDAMEARCYDGEFSFGKAQ